MSTRFSQVTGGRWPNGIDKPIAVLRAEPAELANRYGLRFTAGSDDFDEFQEAALQLKSGRPVLLYRYNGSPSPGTTVTVDQGDRAREALEELATAFQLKPQAIAWVSDEVSNEEAAVITAVRQIGAQSRNVASLLANLVGSLFKRKRARYH